VPVAEGWTDFRVPLLSFLTITTFCHLRQYPAYLKSPKFRPALKAGSLLFLWEKRGRNSKVAMGKGWPKRKRRPKDQATDRNDVREGRSPGLPSKNRPPSRDSHAA